MGYTSSTVKNKYNQKAYDRISLSVKKGLKERYQSVADSRGMSLNEFIRYCIEEEIKKERS